MSRAFTLQVCLSILAWIGAGCAHTPSPAEEKSNPSALEAEADKLSLSQLDGTMLALQVAVKQSLETWRGPSDEAISGCSISGDRAEQLITALQPLLDRKTRAEGERLVGNPKSYRLPLNDENCDRECSCALGLRILDSARLDERTSAAFRPWKKMRAKLEAKAELQSTERSELCVESMTWVCPLVNFKNK